MKQYDVLIIGSGAAGMSLALSLSRECQVAILSKGPLTDSNTHWAQGGLAAVLADDDSIESHELDTLNAGAGLCKPAVVQHMVKHGRSAVDWLIHQGVTFTPADSTHSEAYHLTREGGHSHRRVIHAADATGAAIALSLIAQVQQQSNITLLTEHTAIDLIVQAQRCQGAYVLANETGHIFPLMAKITVLATGGCSKVYLYTSNPDCATGDGIAMAWRKGCRVANMEFHQFHPTCLYHPQAKSFLISEALRGEGAILLLPNGEPFMQHYDLRAELAPRDIVARAIDYEMKRRGLECVYVDISFKSPAFIQAHFPTIHARCLELGIDMTAQPIPVVPAAHYNCGGVITDHTGQTDLPGLYAIGETACTGLHGANRMASNSLLECVVMAHAANQAISAELPTLALPTPAPAWDASQVRDSDEAIIIKHNWAELRQTMWDYVGIVRTNKRLRRALHRIDLLQQEIREYYRHFTVSKDLIELRNLTVVAELIVRCAMLRYESRGLHYNLDYPELDLKQPPHDTVLIANKRHDLLHAHVT